MGGDLSTHSLEDTHDSGDDRYIELQKSLVRDRKNSLDFNAFCRLISSRYERMVSIMQY